MSYLLWVALVQTVEGLNRTKDGPSLKWEGTSVWLLWTGTLIFSSSSLELKHWLFWGLEPAVFQSGTYTISCPGPQALRLRQTTHWLSWVSSSFPTDLGTSQPQLLHESIFFFFLSLCWFCFFAEHYDMGWELLPKQVLIGKLSMFSRLSFLLPAGLWEWLELWFCFNFYGFVHHHRVLFPRKLKQVSYRVFCPIPKNHGKQFFFFLKKFSQENHFKSLLQL